MAALNRISTRFKDLKCSGLWAGPIIDMFYTYALWSKEDNRFYIGYTADLKRRMKEHICDAVHSTSRFESAKLIFYEAFLGKEDAIRRERYFKTTKGKKALRLIVRDSVGMR